MKAIIIPYRDKARCEWANEFFPGRSIASLPICGKPLIEFQLDECAKCGMSDVLVLDWAYDQELMKKLGDGSRWGLHLTYTGADESDDLKGQIQHHAGFVGGDDVRFVLDNRVGDHAIDSLKAYYDANFAILANPGDLVLPGYTAESGVFAGMNVVIKPDVSVAAPVLLGDNVRLERGVKIEDGVVLGEGVVVDRGTRLARTIVFPRTYIGARMDVEGKIVAGRRMIDVSSGVFVDLEEDGLSSNLSSSENERPRPVPFDELSRVRYTGVGDAVTDERVAKMLALIARDIAALNMPKLEGVYLGGGYGRGEGGSPLYNDLDFFVLTRGASEREKEDISVALGVVSMTYSAQFNEGFHIDFCRPKNRRDFRKDEDRIMIQEFIRGNVAIFGKKEALDFLRVREASELPVSEATRYLVNRGMGLLLARTRQNAEFSKRNINKAILGAGDAILVAEGRYAWEISRREKALSDEEYSKAVAYKLRPVGEVANWECAAGKWLDALDRIRKIRGKDLMRRSPRHALRWLRRRKTVGDLKTFGMDPLTRILLPLEKMIREGRCGHQVPAEMMKDWEVFN